MIEEQGKEGLNTAGYAGKWKNAKSFVKRHNTNPVLAEEYWAAVRLHFLELGGEYLNQRCTCTNHESKPEPLMPIIPHSNMFRSNPRQG